MDLSLPDSSGFNTIVKTKEKIKDFPIVVLTGLNDEVIARKVIQIGAQDYLVKGQIESNTLIRAIWHAIDRHEMLTTLESLARSLNNKEIRMREIIENSVISMIVVNENRIIQFVNPAAVRFFNKNPSELVGHEFKFPIKNSDNTEIEVVDKNGKLAIGVMQTVGIEWEGNNSYLLTIQDITKRKKARNELGESKERLAKAQQIAQLGNWEWDIRNNKVFWSDEIYRIFGLIPQEFAATYEAFLNFVHPNDRGLVNRSFDEALHNNKPYSIDHRMVLQDGSEKIVHEQAVVLFSETGEAIQMSGTVQDITDRMIVEQKLRESEENFRNLIENISDAIIEVDLGRKFEYASPQIYNITGFTPEEIINLNPAKRVHPEDFKNYVEAIKKAIESGERLSIEHRTRHKNGHYVPISLRGKIIKDKNKLKLIGLIGDISEKKFVERQLKKLEQSLEEMDALIETAPLAIILMHPKGRILRINEATKILFNYTTKELLNLEVFHLFNSADLNKIKSHYNSDIYNLSSSNKIETSIKTKEGKIIDVEVTSTILKIGNNFIIQSFFSDITERKNFERHRELLLDQLLTSLEFKSKFLATISHELRTPLNAILGFSSLLLEDSYGETNEDQKEFLSDIFSAGNHLLNLIDRVLDLSKIEAGKLKLNYKRVNLTLILNEIKSIVKPLYEEKGLSFKIEGLTNSAYLSADPIRFKQIMYNLLDNAIKFTEKGNITLSCLEKKDHWEFQIKDTGIGIAQEDFEVVFREYGRVENDKIKQVPGSGLGLALTKRLVNLDGGEIWFESKLGKETTFFFTTPKRNLTG